MADPFLFLVPYKFLVDNFTHVGTLGKGKDTLFDTNCTVNVFQESSSEKKYAVQVYHNLQSDLFQKKLDKLSNFMTQSCSQYIINPNLLSFKNYDDKSFDLVVLYDGGDVNYEQSLNDELNEKKKAETPFGEAEMSKLLVTLVKVALLSSKSLEIHSFSPKNIFKGSDYVVSNFGLTSPIRFETKFHCPTDAYFNSSITQVSGNMLIRNLIFQAGMLMLYMGTLQDPIELYSDLFNSKEKVINSEALTKRVELFKTKGGENLGAIVERMVQVKEEKRIRAEDILTMLGDTEIWYDDKVEGGYFRGFIKDLETKDLINGFLSLDSGETSSGKFGANLSKEGQCVYYDPVGIIANGSFSGDNISDGWLFKKNQYAFNGGINSYEIKDGEGLYIPLLANRNPNCLYFKGKISQSKPESGEMVFLDGTRGDPSSMEKEEVKIEKSEIDIDEEQEKK